MFANWTIQAGTNQVFTKAVTPGDLSGTATASLTWLRVWFPLRSHDSTTKVWTALQHDGPNHLSLCCNALRQKKIGSYHLKLWCNQAMDTLEAVNDIVAKMNGKGLDVSAYSRLFPLYSMFVRISKLVFVSLLTAVAVAFAVMLLSVHIKLAVVVKHP